MRKGFNAKPAFKVSAGFGAFVGILSLTPTLCLGWGYDGHRIVGEMGSHYLSPEPKATVKDLLGDETLNRGTPYVFL